MPPMREHHLDEQLGVIVLIGIVGFTVSVIYALLTYVF